MFHSKNKKIKTYLEAKVDQPEMKHPLALEANSQIN